MGATRRDQDAVGSTEAESPEAQLERIEPIDAPVAISTIEDAVNRQVLTVTSFAWYTAGELADICDIPISTTYRKLNELTDAGLIKRRIRLNSSGKHAEEFRCRQVVLTVRVGHPTGCEVTVRTSGVNSRS